MARLAAESVDEPDPVISEACVKGYTAINDRWECEKTTIAKDITPV